MSALSKARRASSESLLGIEIRLVVATMGAAACSPHYASSSRPLLVVENLTTAVAGTQQAEAQLRQALTDADWRVVATALKVIGDRKVATLEPDVIKSLADGRWQCRAYAVAALAKLGSNDPGPFVAAAKDPSWAVREEAIIALGVINTEASLRALMTLPDDSDQKSANARQKARSLASAETLAKVEGALAAEAKERKRIQEATRLQDERENEAKRQKEQDERLARDRDEMARKNAELQRKEDERQANIDAAFAKLGIARLPTPLLVYAAAKEVTAWNGEPDADDSQKLSFSFGDEVTAIGQNKKWYIIDLEEGAFGWIKKTDVTNEAGFADARRRAVKLLVDAKSYDEALALLGHAISDPTSEVERTWASKEQARIQQLKEKAEKARADAARLAEEAKHTVARGQGWILDYNGTIRIDTPGSEEAAAGVVAGLKKFFEKVVGTPSIGCGKKSRWTVSRIDSRIDPSATVLRVGVQVRAVDAFGETCDSRSGNVDVDKEGGRWKINLDALSVFDLNTR